MDANDKSKDAVQSDAGQGSEDAGQKGSGQQKVYSETDFEDKFSSQRSVYDTKINDRDTEITGLKEKLTQLEKDAEDRDKALYADDPGKLDDVTRQRESRKKEEALTAREKAVEKSEQDHRSKLEENAKSNMENKATSIATKETVDPNRLLKLSEHIIDPIKRIEYMETLALELPKVTPSDSKSPLKTVDGSPAGGGELSEEAKLREMYPTMYPK